MKDPDIGSIGIDPICSKSMPMVWWSDKLALSQGKEWQIYLRKTLDAQSSSWHTGDRVMEKRWPS